jgi:hypothetical protein
MSKRCHLQGGFASGGREQRQVDAKTASIDDVTRFSPCRNVENRGFLAMLNCRQV